MNAPHSDPRSAPGQGPYSRRRRAIAYDGSISRAGPGKIEKACATKLSDKLTQKCAGVDLNIAFAKGECVAEAGIGQAALRACLDRLVECRVRLALNDADNLGRDCDEFDDGAVNGSCR